jgi:hypothetical protein
MPRAGNAVKMGNVTTYTWSSGLLIRTINALNQVTTDLYDASRRFLGDIVVGVTQGDG